MWSPIFKRSSVWLLFLASGEFPALGPGGGAPNGLWLTLIPHSVEHRLQPCWLLGECCCVEQQNWDFTAVCFGKEWEKCSNATWPMEMYRALSIYMVQCRPDIEGVLYWSVLQYISGRITKTNHIQSKFLAPYAFWKITIYTYCFH